MKQFRNPQEIHDPLGKYSHQVEISGERMLVMSGQVGKRLDGSIPEDALEQLSVAFDNIILNLQAAGMDVADLFKITYYLVGEFDTEKRREITVAKLGGHQPCSTLLYVAGLASPIYKVEIEAWASR